MIEHIVMIKLKVNSDKTEISKEIKENLENLPKLIDEIKYYEIGLNISKSLAAYDIVLVSRFESLETLETYRMHTEHQKVLDLIKKYAKKTTVVDFKKTEPVTSNQ